MSTREELAERITEHQKQIDAFDVKMDALRLELEKLAQEKLVLMKTYSDDLDRFHALRKPQPGDVTISVPK